MILIDTLVPSPSMRISPIPMLLLVVSLIAASVLPSRADDPGLISAKLTEKSGHAYVLETDIPPQLQNTIGVPILPEGFENQPTEFERRGALINVRYPFTGTAALDPDDTILLPWSRTGALVNARWEDGSRASHMFPGKLEGIVVEIAQLKTIEKSREEAIQDGFRLGFQSVSRNWMLWVPVFCIGLLFPCAQATRFLAMLIAGLTAALVLLDIHPIAIEPAFALGMMMVAVILAVRLPETRLAPVFAAAACLLGLAGAAELPTEPRLARTFGMALFFLGSGSVPILVRRFFPSERFLKTGRILLGGLAFAGILITLLNQAPAEDAKALPPAPLPAAPKGKAAKAPGKLENPFMAFVSIEPYEVRFEVMASGEAITQLLAFPLATPDTIQVDEQEALKDKAIAEMAGRFTLEIDGSSRKPEVQRADFLTLGAAGAFTRTDAIEEPLEPAIFGLTFAYLLTAPPQSLALVWNQLPIAAGELPVTVLEPSGVTGFTFSADQPRLDWKNQSGELRPSTIAAVDVARPSWAPLSIVLLLAGLILTAKTKPVIASICLALALLAAPFIRSALPLASPLPEEQASAVVDHLLTNIYRAFDFRQESTIYDQLAVSVTGEQLNDIYLGQRRALELENRGGARARVENVEVESIEGLTPNGTGVDVHARWNVSGSVNHFGHTHYRQNAYDAILHLMPVEGTWKITAIEVNEEKRIY